MDKIVTSSKPTLWQSFLNLFKNADSKNEATIRKQLNLIHIQEKEFLKKVLDIIDKKQQILSNKEIEFIKKEWIKPLTKKTKQGKQLKNIKKIEKEIAAIKINKYLAPLEKDKTIFVQIVDKPCVKMRFVFFICMF
jgi:hypothetical protein